MNEDTFNLSIGKFLKMVGVSSQREIEQAVAKARAGGAIRGNEKFPASATLDVPGLNLSAGSAAKMNLKKPRGGALTKPAKSKPPLLEKSPRLLADGSRTSRAGGGTHGKKR